MISISIMTSRASNDDHSMYTQAHIIVVHNADTILHPIVKEVSYEQARHLQAKLYKKYGDKVVRENIVNWYDPDIYEKNARLWLYD